MRTTSSIAALHRGHEMLGFVLDSDIPLRRLRFATRHKNNGAKCVKVQEAVGIFLWCSRVESTVPALSGTDLGHPANRETSGAPACERGVHHASPRIP